MSAPIYKGGSPFVSSGIRGKRPITASSSAAVTLKRSQSGGTFLFDRASGTSFTLPSPSAGLWFRFYVSVLQTSGANVVVTSRDRVPARCRPDVLGRSGDACGQRRSLPVRG
jgi:hypothetical protein